MLFGQKNDLIDLELIKWTTGIADLHNVYLYLKCDDRILSRRLKQKSIYYGRQAV